MNGAPEEHWIPADGGIGLHAWVYRPSVRGAGMPAITMAHGFAGLKYQGLAPFAERFARAGFVVIVHDHRGFGLSGGWPRGDRQRLRPGAAARRASGLVGTPAGLQRRRSRTAPRRRSRPP
jgi:uncharacterized protein